MAILATGFFLNNKYYKNNNFGFAPSPSLKAETTPPKTSASPVEEKVAPVEANPESIPEAIPESYLIKNVPFQTQAPFGEWDTLHDEACEEAALILAYYYLEGKNLTAQIMENEIQAMVAWQIDYFGSHKDLTIAELQDMAKKYYQLDSRIENSITIEEIKKEISQDHLVIVPTAGRLLGNPYYRQPGPVYHMLLVIGYDNSTIIVQDIGTRRGSNYKYSQKILFNAIHNWAGSPENIEKGAKTMLVFN